MMASGDYIYVNDLDDGGLMGATVRRHEHSSSLFVGATHDSAGESQSQYDYLDGSLVGTYDGGGDGALTALELEDFVGVDGSNLASVLSESNSVFDIGAEEANMQTQSPSVASRSVSGADFDTLPITPMAKQPIDEPHVASASVPKPAAPNSAVSARHLNLRVNTVADLKRPSTPDKYFEIFGGASGLAVGHNNTASYGANTSTGDARHRSAKDTSNYCATNAAVTAAGKGVAAAGHISKHSTLHPGMAAAGVPTRPSAPPAPPPLHPFPSVSQPHNDSEGFGFGIDTFLHGNQLGFGRQPSFKRLTPALQGELKKPYFLLHFEDGDTNTTAAGAAAAAAAVAAKRHPEASASGTSLRAASAGDRNAEEFSTWLEALEPKAAGLLASVRGGSCTTHAGSAIGENFKREVDIFMKNLLGDYDMFAGATAAAAVNNSSVSGVSQLFVGGSGHLNKRRGSGPSCPGDSQPADLDAFLGDARALTPPLRSPTLTVEQVKQRPRQSGAVGAHTSLVGSPTVKTTVPTTMTAGTPFGGKGGKGSTGAYTRSSATASASPQPPTRGHATKCRRHIWSTSLGPNKSTSAAAVNGDVVPDPTFAVATEALPTTNFAKAAAKPANGLPAQRSCGTAASQTVAAVTCVPSHASTGETSASVAGTAKPATGKATTASAKPDGSVGDVGRARNSATPSTATPYPYMDEDLLAGGYMTRPPQLIRSPVESSSTVLPAARVAMEAPFTNKESGERSGSNTSDVVALAARGCRTSLLDGHHISASQQRLSLLQQKLRPSRHNRTRMDGDSKTTSDSDGAGMTASGALQQVPASSSREGSQESPIRAWNDPYGRAATSLPSESVTAGSSKTRLDSRRNGDSTLGDVGKTFLSFKEAAGEGDLVDSGGTRANVLPPPIFLCHNNSAQEGMTANSSTSGSGATSSHLHCICKTGGTTTLTGCTRRSSRGPGADPVTVEPIALKKYLPIPLRPSFLNRRASASQTDCEAATSGEHGAAATSPRRRLTEFRNGDYMLPAFLPKSRVSATTAEDLHLEALKQQDRDRQTQQANEERRQRIQAFMSKRKAEKQLEELQRRQLLVQEGKLKMCREMQEQQRILEATPHLETFGTVGSGLNAIKAAKRVSKSSPQRDRAVQQSVPAAGLIPKAAMVATVISPHIEVAAPAVEDTLPPAGRGKGNGAVAKTNVRAVVVFTSSSGAEKGGVPVTVKDDDNGRRRSSGSTAPSATASGLFNEGTVGVAELSENSKTLKVQQPQERTRFFPVDEFLRISDAEAPKQVERPVSTRASGVVAGVLSNAALPRRRLSSLTLTVMNRRFLGGVNVALLLASTEKAHHASLTAILEVVEGVLSHMPPHGELFASIAFVAGGNTQDLLCDPERAVRSTFSTSPLFGPTLDNVTYVAVTGIGHLSAMVTESYKRCDLAAQWQQPSAGLLVMSLLLKQPRGSDVLLSSYLITDAGCDGSTYVAALRKAQHTPFALFHSALGGPTLTTALMSVDVDDTATLVPLLNVQHRLASVTNKPCHVGSVRRFLELAQQELQNRIKDGKSGRRRSSGSTIAKVTSERRRNSVSISSSNSVSDSTSCSPSLSGHQGRKQHPMSRAQLHKRLLEQVATAQSILNDPASYRPKAVREPPQARCAKALTSTAPKSTSAAPPLSAATSPRAQRRSADDGAMPSLDLAAPCKRLSTSKAPATVNTVPLPSHSTGSALARKNSPSSTAGEEPPIQLTQLLATRRGSDAPNVESDASATAKASLSPATTHVNHQIAQFRPLQQNSSPLAGCSSASVSLSTAYVRRGNDGGAAPQRTWFMNFEDVGDSTTASVGSRPAAGTLLKKGEREVLQDPPLSTATTTAAKPLQERCNAGDSELSQRGKPALGGGADGLTQRPMCVPPGVRSRSVGAGRKGLLAAPTRIGPNGPQWPSMTAMDPGDIPAVPCVDSIDSSLVHDVSVSARQSLTAHDGERAPIPTSTKVRTLVIVDPRCCETSNVTYDNTMVIATTDDDFEEYDVDEVCEVSPAQESIQADLLTELCKTLLLGGNASILGAESRPTGACAQVLKSVVHTIFADMNREGTHRRGRLSVSIVKVKGESVVDLLKDSGEAQKLVIAISPLFGSCVHGVTYSNITNSATFNATIDAALRRAATEDNGRDYGFLFCSLIFKLQLEEEGDVLVCSLVATFAGEHVGLYTSVLDRSPLVPRALFHYALGGPSYTIALLGIGSEESRANQMLQVQRRLGEVSNRATHPGSVAKFVAGIRNDLTPNLIAKYESTHDQDERAATKAMIGRLAEMVKDADALLHDFDHHQPKAYLHEDRERRTTPAGTAAVTGSDSGSPAMTVPRRNNVNGTNDSNLTNKVSAASAVAATAPPATSRPATQRSLPSITAVNPEGEDNHIQSLVCLEQVLMGAGSVAVHGNSILCTSQGGMRYDSDEVIVCDESHRSLSSKLMDKLVAKFLAGYHTGLLAADSSYSAFTPLMLRCIANSILDAMLGRETGPREGLTSSASFKPPTVTGELYVSIALIKDEVTADLLPTDADATYHRFEMEHKPLYGPRVAGVASHLVSTPQDFDHYLAVAIDNADPALQSADPGIMVVLLSLTQRVTKPTKDVLVSSLLCTAVFDAVHHYELVLGGDTSEPLELFHNILRGPCFTVALFGISDEEENPGKLLRALHGITQARNRPAEVNSVSRHIRELQRGIVKLKERMTPSSNEEKEYILSRVKVAEHLLADAEALQRNALSSVQPRPFVPLGGAPHLRA
ncbi:conserved hypothetical protein [Leishmania major strain Friedlin]|uniref:Kinesin motor domain-containing protein n=1 Tax=Leishmania major TaxID=5664 RepID=Q4Q3P6_LEIMA|nr:conserved hypothetical protein [Leishmania major strain Friedlin]CAG9580971.1 hypothetical_protein_-_conserved [Leishmania major strain Friedlin]CAJ06809.1 conserved hypothetical protein [Leishmania major strain Friedlin]|eukprot:XP_001686052.1 conserved hypothetical protein [Leishmania major strain Friedlin]